jgi:hypothetical protein
MQYPNTKHLIEALSLLKKVLADKSVSKKSFDQIPGGLSEGKTPDDFPKEQLEKGAKVENREHGKHGIEIAMDHLVEKDDYYNYLEEMEKEMESDKNNRR